MGSTTTIRNFNFQRRVDDWMVKCFSREIADDIPERNHRFLEEALELVQSANCTREEAHMLVDYVFDRPVGETFQEIGGTVLTLSALCSALSWDMQIAAEAELSRVLDPRIIAKIQAKQATKPPSSPLPGTSPIVAAEHKAADVQRYLNLVDGKIYELVSKDAVTVIFKREGREKLAYLGRSEFDRRFQLVSGASASELVGSQALLDVAAERERQIGDEGWSPKHDSTHENGELAGAAACYILHGLDAKIHNIQLGHRVVLMARDLWPWDMFWWKPTDRRRNLVKAAALIIAEMERLDRAAIATEDGR